MYKVLIVDDERFIRTSIRKRIEWQKYGLSVEGEAGNGQEALLVLEKVNPDIVFVDIRMPVMDGLKFVEEARKRFSRCVFIIMSAYSDFSYAHKAIKLGVEDYVLKPMDKEEVGKILEKAVHHLNQEHLKNQSYLREGQKSGIFLCSERLAAVAFWLPASEEMQPVETAALLEECSFIRERKVDVYRIEDYSRDNCQICLMSGDLLTQECVQDLLEKLMDDDMPEYTIVAYAYKDTGSDVWETVAKSVWALKNKMFWPERRILSARELEESSYMNSPQDMRTEISRVYHLLASHQYESGKLGFVGMIDRVIRRGNSIDSIEEMIEDSLVMLKSFSKESSYTEFNIICHKWKSQDYLLEYRSPGELKEELRNLLEQAVGLVDNHGGQDVIGAVKSYIRKNYASDLNVTDVAAKFYINANYLSTLFRREAGVKLGNYIEGIRMERAKELLKNSDWIIQEIAAETGYADANYFTKVFKRYTGMTPRQYRKQIEAPE